MKKGRNFFTDYVEGVAGQLRRTPRITTSPSSLGRQLHPSEIFKINNIGGKFEPYLLDLNLDFLLRMLTWNSSSDSNNSSNESFLFSISI